MFQAPTAKPLSLPRDPCLELSMRGGDKVERPYVQRGASSRGPLVIEPFAAHIVSAAGVSARCEGNRHQEEVKHTSDE